MHSDQQNTRMMAGAALALLVAGMLAILFLTPLPESSIWWQVAQDLSHFVLFGACAVLATWPARSFLSSTAAAPLRPYLLAFCFTSLLGIATELMQLGTSRDASAVDLARDIAGAIAGLLLLASTDKAVGLQRTSRGLVVIAAGLLTLLSSWSLACWTVAYIVRQHDFPQLTRLGSGWVAPFIQLSDSSLMGAAAPLDFARTGHSKMALLHLETGRWPGLTHLEPQPDWTGYGTFGVDIYNPSAQRREVTLRIHDRAHNGAYSDRFNRKITLAPGSNQLRVPLRDIERAPLGRLLNLREVAGFSLFAVQPDEAFDLYLGDFTLMHADVSSNSSSDNNSHDVS